jgi:hypothetical protein
MDIRVVAWAERLRAAVHLLVAALLLLLVGWVLYWRGQAAIAAGVYRSRLADLSGRYEAAVAAYNEAVRRTAVTELVVADGKLSVAVRTAEGVRQTFATPFDPDQEIYVDYVVLDGRLWIRRVFDARTSPEKALVIDPDIAHIDWAESPEGYGKAVYRQLSAGRWIVSVSGNGALGLERSRSGAETKLTPPPVVKEYSEIQADIDADLGRVGAVDVMRWLLSGGRAQ